MLGCSRRCDDFGKTWLGRTSGELVQVLRARAVCRCGESQSGMRDNRGDGESTLLLWIE